MWLPPIIGIMIIYTVNLSDAVTVGGACDGGGTSPLYNIVGSVAGKIYDYFGGRKYCLICIYL